LNGDLEMINLDHIRKTHGEVFIRLQTVKSFHPIMDDQAYTYKIYYQFVLNRCGRVVYEVDVTESENLLWQIDMETVNSDAAPSKEVVQTFEQLDAVDESMGKEVPWIYNESWSCIDTDSWSCETPDPVTGEWRMGCTYQ